MPSRRMIDPAFWRSESMAQLTESQRLLFIGIISNADDQGRMKAHAALIRSDVYPYDDKPLKEIEADLEQISEVGSVTLYNVNGRQYLQIPGWWEYQSPQWAYPSKIPPPDGWQDKMRYRKGNEVITANWGDGSLPKDLPKDLPKEQPEGDSQSDSQPYSISNSISNSVRKDLTPSAGAGASNLIPPEPKSPPSEPEKPKTKVPVREDHAMFSALASLCYGDTSVMSKKMRGTLNSTGKTLRDGGAKSTDCAEFSRWWYALDWRGQQRQKPTPALVVECWGAFVEWRKDGGKISGPTNQRGSTILAASTAEDRDHNTPSAEQLAADKQAIAALRKRQQARAGAG